MDGEDPHDVVGLLGDTGVHLGVVDLHALGEPAGEGTQSTPARGAEGPGLVGDGEQIGRGLLTVGQGERVLDEARPLERRLHELGEAATSALARELARAVQTPR
ncbi:MAG: hypothetical protein WKF33_01205 [Thermoleophilaceae bacterium]